MPEYKAKTLEYKTIQGDMWDIIALREYRDEHAMHFIQDDNYYQRFTDLFPASAILTIPIEVSVKHNLKGNNPIPPLQSILPWR